MDEILTFSCDFEGETRCTVLINLSEYGRTKGKNRFQEFKWTKNPPANVLPAYCEWMHSVMCKVADAVQGKMLYIVQEKPGPDGWRPWIYLPGGIYFPADNDDRSKKIISACAKNRESRLTVENEKDARSFLQSHGMLQKFNHASLPGRSVQYLIHDGTPSHLLIVAWYNGYDSLDKNGFALNFIPRSEGITANKALSEILTAKFRDERDGVTTIVL